MNFIKWFYNKHKDFICILTIISINAIWALFWFWLAVIFESGWWLFGIGIPLLIILIQCIVVNYREYCNKRMDSE